ncbi:kinase-like protein [Ceratobasidium sp. AG-I]|nr:kinase-like protein [Ceratobasidium sp. AG-I]
MDELTPNISNELLQSFKTPEDAAEIMLLARGAAADVWRVSSASHPYVRVHKVLRVSPRCFDAVSGGTFTEEPSHPSWTTFVEEYLAQLRKWVPLNHPNIVRVFHHERGDDLSLRVELCENGCVRDYLKAFTSNIDKEKIILDVLSGLAYLHGQDPPLIHGNLNAGKIFVHEDGTTKIGEFGLATLCDPFSTLLPSISFVGDSRWMSPELIDVDIDEPTVPTTRSDIWAIGCTLFEIVTEDLPYAQYKHDIQVQRQVLSGRQPGEYDVRFEGVISVPLWPIVESCWKLLPNDRPSASVLLAKCTPPSTSRPSNGPLSTAQEPVS